MTNTCIALPASVSEPVLLHGDCLDMLGHGPESGQHGENAGEDGRSVAVIEYAANHEPGCCKLFISGAILVAQLPMQSALVDLDHKAAPGKEQINRDASRAEVDHVLVNMIHAQREQSLAHLHLCQRDGESIAGCVSPSTCSTEPRSTVRAKVVTVENNSPREAGRPSLVMAGARAVLGAMSAFPLTRRALYWFSAHRALQRFGLDLGISAHAIGARARARGLSTVPEPCSVCLVLPFAHRAGSIDHVSHASHYRGIGRKCPV